jgi:predicted DNA-binding antitoxin AbrB/MazE fold protein
MVTVRAIYKDGQLHIQEAVELEEGEEVDILIMPVRDDIPDTSATDDDKKPRIPGMHEGAITMSDDFDDPLPDEFWLSDSDNELLT